MPQPLLVLDYWSAGDTQPALPMNWGEGTVDITGWTIKVQLKRPDGTIFEKTATVTDGPAGDFEISDWLSTDLVAGYQPAEVDFNTGSDTFTIRGLVFNVAEQLA